MNGRAFDYNLGRFLSVDPFIASATNSQAINPYSYLGNNPLSGIDPTGYQGDDPCTGSNTECDKKKPDSPEEDDGKGTKCLQHNGCYGGGLKLNSTSLSNGSDNDEKRDSSSDQDSTGKTDNTVQNFLLGVKDAIQDGLVESNCGAVCGVLYAGSEAVHVVFVDDIGALVDSVVAGNLGDAALNVILVVAKPVKAVSLVTKEAPLYRVIRPDENPAAGLMAKNPNATYKVEGHILHGSRPNFQSQYISTTTDLSVAQSWAGKTGNRIVEINRSGVNGTITDLSTAAGRNANLRGTTAKNWAGASSEVLIQGNVPASAMKVIKQ